MQAIYQRPATMHRRPTTGDQRLDWLDDFGEFARTCLKVYPKEDSGELVNLRLTGIQRRFVRERAQRTIVLKARQVRISTACLGLGLWQCVRRRGYRAVTVAQDMDSTVKMLQRVRVMHREMPISPTVDKDNRRELSFTHLDSSYYIGTAGSRRFGRGDRLHFVHLSEFAFWPSFEVWTGIPQALGPDGQIVIESTPNGFNAFYRMVKDARSGVLPYRLLFYPWFLDETYTAAPGVPESEWTDAEKIVAQKAAAGFGVTLTPGQVAWRRVKWEELKGDEGGSRFPQEYPEDEQTCFLASGRPRFDVEHLNALLPQAERRTPAVQHVDGTALTRRTFEPAQREGFYVVGADTAEGLSAGDNCAAAVIDWHTRRLVAQVWGKADPWQFGRAVAALAKEYNNAALAIERNGPGIATVHECESYPNLYRMIGVDGQTTETAGWQTTSASRPVLVDELAEFYRHATAEQCPDPDEIGEAMAFVIGTRGKAEAAQGAHDDLVMARGIALMVRNQVHPPAGSTRRAREWQPRQR